MADFLLLVPCPAAPATLPEQVWGHGKRKVVEPARLLTEQELADRVRAYSACDHEPYLDVTEKPA